MTAIFVAFVSLFVYMCGAFVVSLVRKDNGVADIAYGWGFVLLAAITFVLGAQGLASLIATILVTVWAARLSVRIYLRNRGKPEDFRYRAWREAWGKTFVLRSFLQVYMLQGAVIFIVSLPVLILNTYDSAASSLPYLTLLGIALWGIGFFFEAVGDWQLARFIRNPENKGKVMDQGLWRYTRHPNYFGESLMWWALALVSFGIFQASGNLLLGALGLVGPLLITFLLLKVSGVPMLEARFAGNPAWEAYARKTSVFVPWFPKKGA